MDFNQASAGGIEQLKSIYVKDRAKTLLDIAIQKFDLVNCKITTPGGADVPASLYCVELNYHMERFLSIKECPTDPAARRVSIWKGIDDPEISYQVAAMLLTLERMKQTTWSFGAYLRYALDACNFKVNRPEWLALLAQATVYCTSPFDAETRKLMWHNPVAVALYAAEVATVCGSRHNNLTSEKEIPPEVMVLFQKAIRQKPAELLNAMMDTFIPAFLGNNKEAQMKGFKEYLTANGFYKGPASADIHNNYDSGLLIHTIDVLYRLTDIIRPQTTAEMGMIVLLAVCHDLSEIGVFRKSYRSEAVEGAAYTTQNGQTVVDKKRTLQWPDQRAYHLETKVVWTREDPLPMEPGMKSLHIALGFFRDGTLPKEMCSAICNHKRDYSKSPCCDYPMIDDNLCRNLHIADFMAVMLGEKA